MPGGSFFDILLCSRYKCGSSFRSRRRALQAVGRVIDQRGAHEGKGVWLTAPIERSHDYWRGVANSRTLAIANLKGGVGKTTLATNLGGYLAKEWQKRVLLIDLDFQGSLSSMAFPGKDWLPGTHQSSLAARLISGDRAGRYPAARPKGRSQNQRE